ncbi:peroxiredoxin family protein [Pendulispora rubella]|uniref:thioredoxin-dependent peroxiredoxin n=1 Tax=Pendulispora rubella TaxID=2741070 RepID=A0ABZ2KW66_9BACT
MIRFAPVAGAMGTLFLFGVPLFLALDRMMLLPPSLRDRPWPFELIVVFGTAAIVMTVRWFDGKGRWAALLTGGAIACVLNVVVLSVLARSSRLPPVPPELALGAHVPAVTLQDQGGAPIELGKTNGPLLVVVFRGVWCPYCRKELARLAQQIPRFSSSEVRVYGISADDPDALLRHQRSSELPFSLLSDPEQKVTALCGTSMHCLLLFDRSGALRWGGFSESWRSPPRYEDVLQAAYRLQ